jgi:prophage antirepressor-like protein
MSMEVKLFDFNENQVRVIQGEDGEPWFVAKDVAGVLGYTDTDQAIRKHCKYPKLLKPVELTGLEVGPRGAYLIRESDVYRLITHSKLLAAQEFENLVYETILPSLRKHGAYIMGQEEIPYAPKQVSLNKQKARNAVSRFPIGIKRRMSTFAFDGRSGKRMSHSEIGRPKQKGNRQ